MTLNTFFFATTEPFYLILCIIGHWNVALSHNYIKNIFRVEIHLNVQKYSVFLNFQQQQKISPSRPL